MQQNSKCVFTGVNVYDEEEDHVFHGDLFVDSSSGQPALILSISKSAGDIWDVAVDKVKSENADAKCRSLSQIATSNVYVLLEPFECANVLFHLGKFIDTYPVAVRKFLQEIQ